MSEELAAYLGRPLTPADPQVLAAIDAGPMRAAGALDLRDIDRLLDPEPLPVETGWCTQPDGVAYVAVRTAMPGVTADMVDWWFDWHPRASLRYRVWHPQAHRSNRVERVGPPGAKAHWGTVHHPVEDVGTGLVHARISFCAPSALGFSTDALDDPAVATIACGLVGDDRLHVRHSVMAHVWLSEGDGLVLRSRFWLGAVLRPDLPGVLGNAGARLMGRPSVRRRALPAGLPQALARHCAEEYANLAALLPELHARWG